MMTGLLGFFVDSPDDARTGSWFGFLDLLIEYNCSYNFTRKVRIPVEVLLVL